MATYTPAALIPVTSMTSTTTSAMKFSAAAGTTGIIRTIQVASPGANGFSVSLGADAAGTRIFSQWVAVASLVPAIYNGWWVTSANTADAINILASTTSNPAINGYVGGYTYA